ncbi:hypothetical protein E4K67_23455 [Desulfosporosinus fructosivorans]|uniref:HTH luxR-type domain-containing protein n=1 Tax=Desulfosporosinus fructosivorans TaxID=2018669 RepID=A0A4Z0R274_9FIRM|nr:LuxR C-terminal-related transcriptional regulator [Desulfosporosinus fructosivorans]TGE35726.1 hypothetical protein E4K67_23455 [Desulfosporosinus fructosivorans]
MSAINFMNDKFVPTSLPEICAPRKELLNLYHKAADNRLAVICAPAGYGKTVSTLLWIRDSGRRSIWIGLDEYDNAPFVFYKLFCTGILSVQPDNVKMQEILNSNAFYSSPVDHTINFLLEFAQEEGAYVLVLDDIHTITNKKILKSLPFILKRMPYSFDILLLSRNKLPEELNDFVESRNGVEITASDLAFSMDEIQKYYSALGRGITRAQAQAFFDATGGWAIGINALSQSETLNAPLGNGRFLENYINKHIWERWDTQLREFMLVTSVANEMDAELCTLLTGVENADEILDRLLIQNIFALKTSSHTYRYHHLFLEFLREKLKERTDIDVQGLILKIAGLYYDRKDYFTSLAYYVRTESHDGINQCFYQLNSIYMDFSVEEWINYSATFVLDKLPEEFIRNNITLLIEAAWANFLNGNAEATLKYIDIANTYVASENNRKLLKEEDLLGFACSIGFADFRIGIHEFTQGFSEWVSTLPEQNSNDFNFYTPSITQNFPYMHRSISDCLELIPDMDNRLQSIIEVFGHFYHTEAGAFCNSVRAGLYYEQNMLEKAQEAIMLAQCELKKELRFEMHFCVFILLSQIFDALGKAKESERVKERLTSRIKEENALYLSPNFLAIDTKYRLRDADRKAAKMWLEQHFVIEEEQLRFYKLYQYFTTVRAYIVLSERDIAMEYIEKLKKLSLDYRRPLDTAEVGVLKAALEWATGFRKEAIKTLSDVLLAMQPYRVIRIIADEGAAVLPILKKIATLADRTASQNQLDSHYLNQVLLCAYEVSKKHRGITFYLNSKPVNLSKQQKYIVRLLAQGYTNTEIINLTGLTINTVKSHTKLAYQKLGVNNVADAVIEAKRLGIIES